MLSTIVTVLIKRWLSGYKKILEIDPNNARVIENLKKLQEEK